MRGDLEDEKDMDYSYTIVGGEVTPPPGEEEEEEEEAPPTNGEWIALTGCSEFTFTFTVSPDSTGIPEYSMDFTEFKCGGVQISGGWDATVEPMLSITGGQFTIETVEYNKYGPDWDIVIQGSFDETGTHASGTWKISAEGTTCQTGTWESSR